MPTFAWTSVQQVDLEGDMRRAVSLIQSPATLTEGLRRLADLEARLAPEVDAGPDELEAWVYVQVATRLAARPDALEELELKLDLDSVLSRARTAATGNAESGAMVELVWAGLQARNGQLPEAERTAAEAIERFADSVIYGLELRLDLARYQRQRTNWKGALATLEEMAARIDGLEKAEPGLAAYWPGYRAGLWGERAQIWIELGVLETAWECSEEEQRFATASGRSKDRLNAEQHRALLENLTQDFIGAERRLRRLLDGEVSMHEDRRAVLAGELVSVLLQHARVDPTLAVSAREAVEDTLAGSGLTTRGRIWMELAGADLALAVSGDLNAATAHLARAEEMAESYEAENGEPVHDAVVYLLPLAARHARLVDAGPGELERVRERLEEGVNLLLDRWRQATPPEGVGFLHLGTRREVLVEIASHELAMAGSVEEATMNALGVLSRAHAEGARFRATDLEAPDVRALRADLPLGHGAMIYLPGNSLTHLFLLDRERAFHFPLEGSHALRDSGRALNTGLRSIVRSRGGVELALFEGQLAEHGERVLPSEARRVLAGWDAVTVIGGELLQDPPLACLPAGEGDTLLGERIAICHVPSLALWAYLRDRPAFRENDGASADMALLATLDVSPEIQESYPGLAPRELSEQDLAGIVGAVGDWSLEVLLGDDVTAANVFDLDLADVPVVHFLAHGVWNQQQGSQLVLAGGEVLGQRRLRELDLGGVVLLSACQASRGYERFGDDRLLNLGGALLEAGARSVVLARTDVELHAVLSLKAEVLRALVEGAAPAEALRRARAKLAASASREERLEAGAFHTLGLGHERLYR